MKIDFNRKFKNYKDGELSNEMTMGDAIAQNLFAGTGLKQGGDVNAEMKKKYAYFKLSQKIQHGDGETEYTAEELSMIKEVSSVAFVPGAYGQIKELIDGVGND